MSVILDVLKKLDREKSARRNPAANIALEILKSDPPRPHKRRPLYLAAIGLTALATAAITYTLMGFGVMNPPATGPATRQASDHSGPRSASPLLPDEGPPPLNRKAAPAQPSIDPAKSLPASGHKATPAPLLPEKTKSPPAFIQKATPAPPSPEPGRETREEAGRVPAETPTPAENRMTTTVAPNEKAASPAPPQPTAERSAPLPSLKISAIIWYDDPSRRFAMINDTMTHEGSIIEEVTVEEIYPNRVRFSHRGRQFEISVK